MRIEQLDNVALENARKDYIDKINTIFGKNTNDYVQMWLAKLSLYELKALFIDLDRVNKNKTCNTI